MTDLNRVSDFEAVKFLMDCAFKEADLFWKRNAVFLTCNLVTFGAAFALFTKSSEPVPWSIRLPLFLFGIFLCVIWILTTRSGRFMNHVWVAQAKLVVKKIDRDELKSAISGTPSDSVTKIPEMSATKLMYILALGFCLAWSFVVVIGPGGIV